MSFLQKIRQGSEKQKQTFAGIVALVIVAMIVAVGIFWYQAPYKKTVRKEYNPSNINRFKTIIPSAAESANQFVAPVNDYFTQQNSNISSDFEQE